MMAIRAHAPEGILFRRVLEVAAEQVGACKGSAQRLGECSRVDIFPQTGQARLDPVSKLVLSRGEFRRGAEGRLVFAEVIAQRPKRRPHARQRRKLWCLKKESEKESQAPHAKTV